MYSILILQSYPDIRRVNSQFCNFELRHHQKLAEYVILIIFFFLFDAAKVIQFLIQE